MQKRISAVAILAVAIAWAAVLGCESQAKPEPNAGSSSDLTFNIKPAGYPFTFIAYGDIRFTDPADTAPSDPVRRQALVKQIAKEDPAFLLISGDIAYNGGDTSDWAEYRKETAAWREENLQIFPALGNHDVRGGQAGLDNYFAAFPQVQRHRWYTVHYGNCFFIILDSDSDHSPGSPQGEWLKAQLANIPQDTDFVFLVLHHPPYTKSSEHFAGGGHDARESEKELAAMLEAKAPAMKQKIIVIAGHVHNYERYEHGGVTYIVSGGGGAAPYVIARSPGDFYNQPGPTYHYCTFKVDRAKLHFEMHKLRLENGKAKFSVEDQFDLNGM